MFNWPVAQYIPNTNKVMYMYVLLYPHMNVLGGYYDLLIVMP